MFAFIKKYCKEQYCNVGIAKQELSKNIFPTLPLGHLKYFYPTKFPALIKEFSIPVISIVSFKF